MSVKICINTIEKHIAEISKKDFFTLEKYLLNNNLASDKEDASTIKSRLMNPPVLSSAEFAKEVIYVILASGFSQKTAKKKFVEITGYLQDLNGQNPTVENLMKLFNNKNKMSAVAKIWINKKQIRDNYYEIKNDADKMKFLRNLPFIGEITQNHIARNLGVNTVKPDVWIVRLSAALGYASYREMFENVSRETNLPIGYIDVILWKSCQIGIIKFDK